MVARADEHGWLALGESADLVVNMLKAGVPQALAPEFSAAMVKRLVQEAVAELPPVVVRICNGPESVCGVYRKVPGEELLFQRDGVAGEPTLVLRWVRRHQGEH
eukprot:3778151-Amphidinium_carterae.1